MFALRITEHDPDTQTQIFITQLYLSVHTPLEAADRQSKKQIVLFSKREPNSKIMISVLYETEV